VTAPITSARVRELSAKAKPGLAQMVIRTDEDMAQIAKALDLWEKVQGGDAGLVRKVAAVLYGHFETPQPWTEEQLALSIGHFATIADSDSEEAADIAFEYSAFALAALAALVGEVDRQALGGTDERS
jgi:hypothetical protein